MESVDWMHESTSTNMYILSKMTWTICVVVTWETSVMILCAFVGLAIEDVMSAKLVLDKIAQQKSWSYGGRLQVVVEMYTSWKPDEE